MATLYHPPWNWYIAPGLHLPAPLPTRVWLWSPGRWSWLLLFCQHPVCAVQVLATRLWLWSPSWWSWQLLCWWWNMSGTLLTLHTVTTLKLSPRTVSASYPSPQGVSVTLTLEILTISALLTWGVWGAGARTVQSQEDRGWDRGGRGGSRILHWCSSLTPPSQSSLTRTPSSTWPPRWPPGSWRTGSTSPGRQEIVPDLYPWSYIQVPTILLQWLWQGDKQECKAGGNNSWWQLFGIQCWASSPLLPLIRSLVCNTRGRWSITTRGQIVIELMFWCCFLFFLGLVGEVLKIICIYIC